MRGRQKSNVPLGLKYFHVNVFSSKPLSGNGVTVFQLREALPTAVMQELTREMRQFAVRARALECTREANDRAAPVCRIYLPRSFPFSRTQAR